MISVGISDERKGLGLGFGGGREMEETELEEGEACFYQNDKDPKLDPDVALSYLDEKLEHVLGHFQKDFEGGVSAENLGPKFGGYGSFLPTYQRSPVWSHPRTPPKIQNHNASRSPTSLPLEGARGNSVSSSASTSARLGSAAVGASLTVPMAAAVDGCLKREVTVPVTNAENKSDDQSDQKTYKVRIKMSSDNLPTQKNAEIYSGLGLDVSPTSSFEESPTGSGFSRESQDYPDESPTSILEIMTSFPLHRSLLLSPLHDDLIYLTDEEMLPRESRSVPIRHKGSQESSLISLHGSDPVRCDRKLLGEKQPKPAGKEAFTVQLKSDIVNKQDGIDVQLKKETGNDTFSCDELGSNALRLPLQSYSCCSVVNSAKDTAEIGDISKLDSVGWMKEESFSDLAKDESLGPAPRHENGCIRKPNGKAGSAINEFKKANFYDDESGYLEKGGNIKSEEVNVSVKVDSNMSKARKSYNAEAMVHAKHENGQKAVLTDDGDKKMSSGKENSSGSKRKPKGGQSYCAGNIKEVQNGNMKTDMMSATKSRKSANISNLQLNKDVEDIKQDIGAARDRYKEFFGDLELEMGENDIADDVPFVDKLTNYPGFDKSNGEFISTSKEQSNSKKIDRPSTSEAPTRVPSSEVPPVGHRPISDTAAPLPPVVQEDWVCCDKCQKWRLLPAGKNPDSLPKTWVCAMLNWLDGMNRCSFSEEETTKAVLSLHQNVVPAPAPAHEGQISQNRYPGVTSLGEVDALHLDQSLHDIGGKKKHGSKDVLNASSQNGSSPYSNSKKKTPQASVKNRNLNGGDHSSSLHAVDFQLTGQSSGLIGQKHRHKKKEKNRTPGKYHDEGDTKSSEIRNKRDADQDFPKASKKFKASGVYTDEERKSDNGGVALKVGHGSSSGLSMSKTGEHRQKYDDHSKESKQYSKVSVRNSEERTQFPLDARLLHTGDYINGDVKKRKMSDYHDMQLYTTSGPIEGHRHENHRNFIEETSETSRRKEKKVRMPKRGGKESSMSKGSGGIDKQGRILKDQQPGVDLENSLSHRSLDAIDSVKKVMGSTQPPVAATSSSSKVSGSHKSKANLAEVKGSPVESVSSSPLRFFNQDKFTSSRKCSDGEDGVGSDQSRMARKNAIVSIIRDSLESSMLDLQDRDQSNISKRKASPAFATHFVTDTLQADQYPGKPLAEQCPNDESGKRNQYHTNGSRRKSGKGSSSRSKDKSRGTRSESEKVNVKASDSNGYEDHSSCNESPKARSKLQEKIALKSENLEKNIFSKDNPATNPLAANGRREAQSNRRSLDGSDARHVISNHDSKNLPIDCNGKKDSKRFPSDKTDRDASGKGKSHSLPPSGRGQNEMTRWPQPINGFQKENGGVNISSAEAIEGDDALKASKQIKRSENQSGSSNQPSDSRIPINSHKVQDVEAPSPVRRDSFSQAANNAVKEAKALKHSADRLKNSASSLESTGLYFQSALKFLHGASLLESSNSENSKHGELIKSMQMYSSTAKLCEFCAHEYEKSKDMASAALAYKCVEVAYLRVINSSHPSASKDRHELQAALQVVPPGESPSSSASDVDNLNNPVAVDKVTLTKGVNSPQVAGNHVIPARSRPNFVRLLNFAQDVNFAMEASRKSRTAFSAAISRLEDTKFREGMPSVKKALDFNFQDVEGLLRLVRLAMEAISR